MNASIKSLINKLTPFLAFAKRYIVFSFFIVLLCVYGFLVFRINSFTQASPSDSQVSDKLKVVQRPHIDQSTIDKIQQLQDQNVQVQSLFDQARNNPFSE